MQPARAQRRPRHHLPARRAHAPQLRPPRGPPATPPYAAHPQLRMLPCSRRQDLLLLVLLLLVLVLFGGRPEVPVHPVAAFPHPRDDVLSHAPHVCLPQLCAPQLCAPAARQQPCPRRYYVALGAPTVKGRTAHRCSLSLLGRRSRAPPCTCRCASAASCAASPSCPPSSGPAS